MLSAMRKEDALGSERRSRSIPFVRCVGMGREKLGQADRFHQVYQAKHFSV